MTLFRWMSVKHMLNHSNISILMLPYDTYYIYVVISTVVILLSLFPIVVIITSKKYRYQKEYVLLLLNLIHELINAMSWGSGGIHRLIIFYNHTEVPLWTRGSCFMTIHIILFTITIPGSGIMVLVIAIDRLLAVRIPYRYSKFSRIYAIKLTIVCYGAVIPLYIICAILVYGSKDYRNRMTFGTCEFSGTTFPIVVDMVRGSRALATLIGVFLYLPITVELRQVFRPNGQYSHLSNTQRRNLLRYNFIVSVIIINELILIVIPDLILIIWPDIGQRYFLYILNLMKELINVCIIVFSQKELRQQCFYLFLRIFCPMMKQVRPNMTLLVIGPRCSPKISEKRSRYQTV